MSPGAGGLNLRGALKWWLVSAVALAVFLSVGAIVRRGNGTVAPDVPGVVDVLVAVSGLLSAVASIVTAITGLVVLLRRGPKGRHSR